MPDRNRIPYQKIALFVGDTVAMAMQAGLSFREGRAGMVAVAEVMQALQRGESMSREQVERRIERIVQRELVGPRAFRADSAAARMVQS